MAERKIGFGKTLFVSCICYGIGCFILYASNQSAGLFIFAMGVVIGVSAGGNSFPLVLASIGRRFPQKSKQQSIAFGIVSSFGSFGQCCFLPIARAMVTSIGWRLSFVIMGKFFNDLTFFSEKQYVTHTYRCASCAFSVFSERVTHKCNQVVQLLFSG